MFSVPVMTFLFAVGRVTQVERDALLFRLITMRGYLLFHGFIDSLFDKKPNS